MICNLNTYARKVFFHIHVDNLSKLDEPGLPDDTFYNNLTDEGISERQYQQANKVWDVFQCQTLGDYSDVYLKSDVLLLTDIFENYRYTYLKTYNLDAAQYFTAPGLSWDAMLRYTNVELELLTDPDMVHFFKKGVRDGVSTCVNRKSIAHNPLIEKYNSLEPTKYIMYLDATNLYDTADIGYVFEVDLEYPEDLHNAHNDLPFCPENIIPPNSRHAKLIPNLQNKEKYIIHYINLKQCLKFVLKVTKIYRVLKFTQSPWLKKIY
ncbi:hypothetical protein NQ318_021628 [Aromia moschata]|uniref:DNA-directed DNA polymerase n=1 Tax=Aromia moschata TaxID=1265417 RepID=A0AAV8X9I5_9CUCU|nr:hypothetical protein NQ318_021628 [Aromia moschata]